MEENIMPTNFNEDNTIEQMIISTLKNNGWKYIPAEDAHVR